MSGRSSLRTLSPKHRGTQAKEDAHYVLMPQSVSLHRVCSLPSEALRSNVVGQELKNQSQ